DQDRLILFSDTVQADLAGAMTGSHISGLGMADGDTVLDNGVTVQNGITYANLHVVEVLLGRGNDDFTITGTGTVENPTADGGTVIEHTLTVVHGGAGNDHLAVTGGEGPIVLFGDTSANGLRYSADSSAPNGAAYAFPADGDDVIDASGAGGIVVIDGGGGNDVLTGSAAPGAVNFIAGGSGNARIESGAGRAWILGDSGFGVDYASRTLIIHSDGTGHRGAAELARHATIRPAGQAVILGDYGTITQRATVAGSDLVLAAGVLDMMRVRQVVEVRSLLPANGGDDVIEALAGGNILIGGAGSDRITVSGAGTGDVVIGDNGIAQFAAGLLVRAAT